VRTRVLRSARVVVPVRILHKCVGINFQAHTSPDCGIQVSTSVHPARQTAETGIHPPDPYGVEVHKVFSTLPCGRVSIPLRGVLYYPACCSKIAPRTGSPVVVGFTWCRIVRGCFWPLLARLSALFSWVQPLVSRTRLTHRRY